MAVSSFAAAMLNLSCLFISVTLHRQRALLFPVVLNLRHLGVTTRGLLLSILSIGYWMLCCERSCQFWGKNDVFSSYWTVDLKIDRFVETTVENSQVHLCSLPPPPSLPCAQLCVWYSKLMCSVWSRREDKPESQAKANCSPSSFWANERGFKQLTLTALCSKSAAWLLASLMLNVSLANILSLA